MYLNSKQGHGSESSDVSEKVYIHLLWKTGVMTIMIHCNDAEGITSTSPWVEM